MLNLINMPNAIFNILLLYIEFNSLTEEKIYSNILLCLEYICTKQINLNNLREIFKKSYDNFESNFKLYISSPELETFEIDEILKDHLNLDINVREKINFIKQIIDKNFFYRKKNWGKLMEYINNYLKK